MSTQRLCAPPFNPPFSMAHDASPNHGPTQSQADLYHSQTPQARHVHHRPHEAYLLPSFKSGQ
ncbi:hypothetical protein BDZ89DRAFT_1131577 [Hymenopellis radicata]|nr:hypothetical protein BDZ89DRAFT_1131577 [Hymenopellis radicata]